MRRLHAVTITGSADKTRELMDGVPRGTADRRITHHRSLVLMITRLNYSEAKARGILHLPVD